MCGMPHSDERDEHSAEVSVLSHSRRPVDACSELGSTDPSHRLRASPPDSRDAGSAQGNSLVQRGLAGTQQRDLTGAADTAEDGRLRIMLVDDATDALRIMCHLLTALGCKVLDLNQPESCSRKAKYFRPDLVLLDLSMPGMDGF